MLKASGSNIAELVNFHFQQEEKVAKQEEKVAKQENKKAKEETEEETKEETKETKKNPWKPYPTGVKWGDYSDYEDEEDEEDEEFPPLNSSREVKEEKKEAVKEKKVGSYLNVISSSVVLVDNNKKLSNEDLKGFITKTSSRKQGLPVVYTVGEFIEEIKMGNKPNKDFIIDADAHCKHTYEGTLCENVRACGKIHVQRCTRGEDCSAKNCSYLHSWDMRDDDADRMFRRTMRKYNALKASKQVKL